MKYFAIFILTVAIALASCSKDSTNPSDDNNNKANAAEIDSDLGNFSSKQCFGTFYSKGEHTKIEFYSFDGSGNKDTNAYSITLTFKGTNSGNYTANLDNSISIMIDNITYESNWGSGKMEITKYGDVGETIEGKFSGTLKSDGATLKVTSATFTALRLPDSDEDFELAYLELNMTNLQGETINYVNSELDGRSEYRAHLAYLGLNINDEFHETYTQYGFSFFSYNISNKNNQTIDLGSNPYQGASFHYKGTQYEISGQATITNFARKVGDRLEIIGSGEFFDMQTDKKAGNIQNFKIRITRKTSN